MPGMSQNQLLRAAAVTGAIILFVCSPGISAARGQDATTESVAAAGTETAVRQTQDRTTADGLQQMLHPAPPPRPATTREKLREALLTDDFRYDPGNLTDPFVPFTRKEELPAPEFEIPAEDTAAEPPPPQLPLTRLQKMGLGEVESGLKAIVMGPLGRKALIQDNSGKGYIVVVGTPVTGNDGVVADIFRDAIVIRQEFWDRKKKRFVPKETLVTLKTEEKTIRD